MLVKGTGQINSIFERIVQDKNGILVRVRFTLTVSNGLYTPQIISITPLVAPVEDEVICLPTIEKAKAIIEEIIVAQTTKVSPYFTLEFLMSQPTRAPSIK